MKKIFISAGEASGDMHAAAVIEALLEQYPQADISGIAGPAMRQAGCREIAGMHELNVMGVVDVLKSLPRIQKVRRRVLEYLATNPVDVVILVDFPGFHINIGRRIRQMGIPVLQYIAPKLWAWGSWRAKKLRASQDRLASILPFEPEWFEKHDIKAEYVGNPSAATSFDGWSREEFIRHAGLQDNVELLAILPGSRPSELTHHVPLLAAAWKQLHSLYPELCAIIPLAPGVDETLLAPLSEQGGVHLIQRMQNDYRLYADAAIAVSGTATLELALWDIPTVLVYRTSPFTVFMARRVVKLEHIGLANLLLGRTAMPELIQEQASTEAIVSGVEELLDGTEASSMQRRDFAELRALLGDMDPAAGVVRMAANMAGESR
ncbi:MAG: lipid-A-disaccharide synthase [Zetaproteobacteria bacterium CG_4_10_14_0_2_um_filter_55_20]|nr:MAG: lipid-A-disaccharide synthase [Zetaproteobacteria bacterium CG1_02_55_237]PIS19887.1 MAG: lipid-A-disaccharide synthase [Zetaproteobacteria bacterium CG08_land_8_20_14_0_20_55_17]PIY51300.1 MAG: lipid-A-disaccharide synthase [Zetaproteobacteria bacterium CG_4_10_14_0_8_um_filter_55_43]PIZ36655.1 MAG: lipid-A-disaccharide synthase [Zetaproteobacteria bacterium CG_4_10_14_0_2_um_filter_55_20]PJB80222.1 MAG: lipid-A-disaccharide synthase [Zetaproteobacteria bacterium CG_4_9_14_0_8_um_filte